MSNKRVIVGGIIVVSLVVTLFLPVAIRQIAQRQISSVAPGAAVRISRCTVNPFSTISFYGLTVQRPFFYDLSVGELTIRYDLMRGRVRLVEVKDASVAVTAPKESIGSLTGLVRLGKGGGIPVDELAFSGIGVSCDTQDLGGELRIDSLRYALGSGSVEAIDAAVDSLRYTGLHLRDARISCALGKAPGRLSVAEVSYDKLKVREIASALRLEKNTAYLDGLTLGVFGGTIEGSLAFALTAPFSYTVTINAAQIDIEAAVSDFNLAEKFQMTGRANGAIALSGAGTAVRSLAGDLASVAPGGRLVIKDTGFLENMARSSGSSLGLVVDSFKDYRYSTGVSKMGFEKNNLILDVDLDGASGKRSLEVTVHDFDLGDITGYLKKK